MTEPLIFDGHNDVLLRLLSVKDRDPREAFSSGRKGHVDLVKARAGGFGGGFFALYVPSPSDAGEKARLMAESTYDVPLPEPVPQGDALNVVMAEAAMLMRLQADGALRICRTAAEIRACLGSGVVAAVMHVEGAEAIDPDFATLEVLYRAGLRSLGPFWSRPNIFGHGVPFRFPASGDIGPGLTEAGEALVRECNRLRIMVDLSHMNEAGFWDVSRISDAPLVATHSNAQSICQSSRNLTDRQLDAIGESQGMVGVNFSVSFLDPEGRRYPGLGLDVILRHLDHLIDRMGEDCVGFGSDFDGATMPEAIGDASGLPALRAAMRGHGYDDALMDKLCHGNWLRVLGLTWGS